MNWRRVVVFSVLFLVALTGLTYWVLTRSDVARDLVERQLHRLFPGEIALKSAELDPIGGQVRLERLRVAPKDSSGSERKDVLDLPNVLLGVSMNPLGGAGEVRSVLIDGAELDIDLGAKEPLDLSQFLRQGGSSKGKKLPSIRIRNLVLRLHLPGDERVLTLEPVELSLLPDRDDETLLVLEGSAPSPLGGSIALHGRAREDGSMITITAEAEECEVDAQRLALLGPDVVNALERLALRGFVAATFWLDYDRASDRFDTGVRGDFRDLRARPPVVPYEIDKVTGRIEYRPGAGGTLGLAFARDDEGLKIDGEVEVSGLHEEEQAVRLRANGRDLPNDERLRSALKELDVAARVLDAFDLRGGRADLALYVDTRRPVLTDKDPSKEPRLQVDVRFRETSMLFAGWPQSDGGRGTVFPYRFDDCSADVAVRDSFVEISKLSGKGRGACTLEGYAQLDFERDEATIRVSAKTLPIDDELGEAVAATLDEKSSPLEDFALRGAVDTTLQLDKRAGQPDFDWSLTVAPRGTALRWKRFPVAVEKLDGQVHIDAKTARFELTGRTGSADLQGRGRIEVAPQGSRELWFRSTGIQVDDGLRQALIAFDASFDETWRLFEPAGKANVEFVGYRASGSDDLSYDLRADIDDGAARFAPFPVALRDVEGPIVVHGDGKNTHVEILGLTGRGLDARLSFQGTLDFAPDREALADLDVVAKGVQLREELGAVLDTTSMIDADLWQLAAVTGSCDAVLEIQRREGDTDWRKSLEVDLREVKSEAKILPDTLTELRGSLRIDNDHVIHIDRLRGSIGEAPLMFEKGRIALEGDATHIELELSADNYPVDDRLANLLSGEVKRAYLDRNARGSVSLVGAKVDIRVPTTQPAGSDELGLRIDFVGGEIRAHGLSMDLGVRVDDIRGYAVLERGWVRPDGSEIKGQLGGLSFTALGQPFDDARGPFVATHRSFEVPTGEVRVHGGVLRSMPREATVEGKAGPQPLARYDFDTTRHLAFHFDLVDLDLGKAVAQLELGQPYRGLMSGKVDLGIDVEDPTSLAITAKLGVRDGWLGDAPIFRSIYGLLKQEKRPTFHAAVLDVQSEGQTLRIDRLLLLSTLLRVEGKGQLDYDGYLELQLEFPNLFPEASPITLLPGIYRAVANALVSFDVSGYVGNLRSGPRFVPFEKRPDKRPVEPIVGRSGVLPPIFRD